MATRDSGSYNKVVSLKTFLTEKTRSDFDRHFKVSRIFHNDFICWGMDSVVAKNGEKVDLISKRKELYEQTNKSLSFEVFSQMLRVYFNISIEIDNSSNAIAYAVFGYETSLLLKEIEDLNESLDESIQEVDRLEKEAKTLGYKKIGYKPFKARVFKILSSMDFFKSRPYYGILEGSEIKSAHSNSVRMITSWSECNSAKEEDYKTEDNRINGEIAKFNVEEACELENFYKYCSDNNIIKNFSWKTEKYITECIVPALKSGVSPNSYFVVTDKRGKESKINYSLDKKFFEYFKNNEYLKSNHNLISNNIELIIDMKKHSDSKKSASFPFIGESDLNLPQMFTGKNYINSFLESEGESVEDIEIPCDIKGSSPDFEEVKIIGTEGKKVDSIYLNIKGEKNYICTKTKLPNGKFHNNPYFKNLKHWYLGKVDENGKVTKCKYISILGFEKYGRQVYTVVKEPSIVYSKKTRNYEVRINMGGQESLENYIKRNSAKWLFKSALPSRKSEKKALSETPLNENRISILKNGIGRYMGVDLGLRNPFAYSIGEYNLSDDANVSNIKILEEGKMEQSMENLEVYSKLLNEIVTASRILGKFREKTLGNITLSDNEQNIIQESINYLLISSIDNRKKSILKGLRDKSPIEIFNYYYKMRDSIKDKKLGFNWIGSILYRYISLRFHKVKDDRRWIFDVKNRWDYEFKWIDCIEKFKRFTRQCSYIGEDNDRKVIETKKLNDYYEGCKDNYLKHISSSIIKKAIEYNCTAIAVESLEESNSKSFNKKADNYLLSLWSPKTILDSIENASKFFNIAIVDVSENCTSQVHYETGKFGYRDKDKLHYELDGEIKNVDADVNASKNILLKMLSRHGSTRGVFISNKSENGEESKRKDGFLTKYFGDTGKAKEFFKDKFPEESSKSGGFYVYLHGDEWITSDDRKNIESNIKKALTNADKNSKVKKSKNCSLKKPINPSAEKVGMTDNVNVNRKLSNNVSKIEFGQLELGISC